MGSSKNFVTFINNFLRKVWVYMLRTKGECLEKFKELKAFIETRSKHKIKVFWSDNSGEFILKEFKRFLKEHGVEKQASALYRPQQYGVAEHSNYTIMKMMMSMLHG